MFVRVPQMDMSWKYGHIFIVTQTLIPLPTNGNKNEFYFSI